jgi:Na+/H+ antiporter NhaA
MAFFFALITQEIVEATMPKGALHSWRSRGLSIAAAAGGALGAVLVYVAWAQYKHEPPLLQAWPIALSVDLVTTYYVMRAIMRRGQALPFALAIAMLTDIFAIVLVAPRNLVLETRAGGAALLVVGLGLAALLRARRVRAFAPYFVLCGPLIWLAFYWEGLHPAFSLVPLVAFLPHEPRHSDPFADPVPDDAVHRAEHEWNEVVQPIAFLFGLVNGGVIWTAYDTGSWGMLLAHGIGRPAGILVAIGIAAWSGLHLPRPVGWREAIVIAFATSSGFAVGLFLATGLLAPGPLLAQIKVGVLGSAAGVVVTFALARLLRVGRFAH